jgi:hypothetical protein
MVMSSSLISMLMMMSLNIYIKVTTPAPYAGNHYLIIIAMLFPSHYICVQFHLYILI